MHSDQQFFRPPNTPGAVRIVPLGGCGEFGMNLTAFLTGGRLFVVDCGVRFPEPSRLGVDAILPDVGPWFSAAGGVHAYILTHGHEDHLGAIPHVLQRWPAPVYGTAWTIELLRNKLGRMGLSPDDFRLIQVEAGDHVVTEGFDVEYVHVNHSIPMTCSLFIRLPGLTIFHTGDFKFEAQPALELPADFERLAAIGEEGVDVMLIDSTNADKSGFCPAEDSVLEPLRQVVDSCPQAAIVTTFSSNLWRLKTIADVCIATGRKLYISGAGIENTLTIAKKLGLYHIPENLRISDEQLGSFPRSRLVVLATGCQGEWRSGLARIANEEHRTFKAVEGDCVIWSSRLIPGNEKAVLALINAFLRRGVRMVTAREAPGIHVSGHAYGGDIDRLVQVLKPRNILPVHGAISQLQANLQRSQERGTAITAQLIESGDVLDVTREGVTKVAQIPVELVFVDAEASTLLSHQVLRERLRVGELGSAHVDGVFDLRTGEWLIKPSIEFTGLALPLAINADEWRAKKSSVIATMVSQRLVNKGQPAADVHEEVRLFVRRQLQHLLRKKPVVTVKLHIV